MKKIVLVSALTAVSLVLVGCAQKAPEMASASASATSSISSSSSSAPAVKFESVRFNFDKSDIRKSEQPVMESNAKLAKAVDAVTVEGNCDEFGTDEYNYALGLKRAKSVKDSLVAKGVASGKITVVSYGESNPTCKDKTKACYAQNRRVDFK